MIEHWGSITASIVAQCFLVFIIRFLIGTVLLCRFIESLKVFCTKKSSFKNEYLCHSYDSGLGPLVRQKERIFSKILRRALAQW